MDWFTSDPHYDHENIIKFSKRPFSNVEEMNGELVRRWNSVVKPGDRVFLLGDIAISKNLPRVDRLLSQLAGQKFWILGNHDRDEARKVFAHRFQKIDKLMDLKIGSGATMQHIVLCHFAMIAWNKSHHGSWMLHGHHHGGLVYPFPAKIADVGVDCWDYTPVSFEELKKKLDPMPVVLHHAPL